MSLLVSGLIGAALGALAARERQRDSLTFVGGRSMWSRWSTYWMPVVGAAIVMGVVFLFTPR